MAVDVLEPGPNGHYPYWPRDAQGRPITTERHARDAGSGTYVPTGIHIEGSPRGPAKVDLTPRDRNGNPITPPTIPPGRWSVRPPGDGPSEPPRSRPAGRWLAGSRS